MALIKVLVWSVVHAVSLVYPALLAIGVKGSSLTLLLLLYVIRLCCSCMSMLVHL